MYHVASHVEEWTWGSLLTSSWATIQSSKDTFFLDGKMLHYSGSLTWPGQVSDKPAHEKNKEFIMKTDTNIWKDSDTVDTISSPLHHFRPTHMIWFLPRNSSGDIFKNVAMTCPATTLTNKHHKKVHMTHILFFWSHMIASIQLGKCWCQTQCDAPLCNMFEYMHLCKWDVRVWYKGAIYFF